MYSTLIAALTAIILQPYLKLKLEAGKLSGSNRSRVSNSSRGLTALF